MTKKSQFIIAFSNPRFLILHLTYNNQILTGYFNKVTRPFKILET